ncbi:hypothetical protein TSUD_301570 [Trifolium subterraneum]|uniref:Uncharacterized protein n=1 Tax=Trifolium subterraneum TaxID=3900 RepID=A0A2Z6P071_TRISU|nr:hypothetical protein TSUD_301570 [Trifolium subterraneum]
MHRPLVITYKILGEDIWRFVGKLTDAQKSMLDDRFKWKVRRWKRVVPYHTIKQSGEIARSLAGPILRNFFGQSDNNIDRQLMPRPLAVASGPTDWNEALDIISFGSPEQVGNMTRGCKNFNFSLTGASSRSCKYVLNTLMQTFQNKRLAHAIKENTLGSLITELLLWLLDDRVPHMDDESQLLKALNVLMLKILDNADQTSSYIVLINLLRPLDQSRWPSPASNESFTSRNQKFSDLVVKCIHQAYKDRILQSIHLYLQDLGMEEIRRRAGADDKPLRMVKTVLHELVKLLGAAINGHLIN